MRPSGRRIVARQPGQRWQCRPLRSSFQSLDQAVREVIVLAADLPDEVMPEIGLIMTLE